MKKILALVSTAIMFLLLPVINAQADQSSLQPPPVSQPLVREGDFALSLANVLKIGEVSDEAQAESMLTAVGVAPKNGWIADYPVTPDILGEIEDSICLAAGSGYLGMNTGDAVNALNKVSEDFGLYTSPSPGYTGSNSYTGTIADSSGANVPDKDYSSRYTNPTTINNYYYAYGPPVISYYPPPWDYYYMYTWVPYQFRWNSFWFPGFYTLSDFGRVIIVRGHHRKIVSNHVFDHKGRTVFVINPERRSKGEIHKGRTGIVRGKGFTSPDAKDGALSILKRSYERRTEAVRRVKTERNPGLSNSLSKGRQEKEALIRQQPSFSRPENSNNPQRISPQRPAISSKRPSGKIRGNGESSSGVSPGSRANSVTHAEESGPRSRVSSEVPHRISERSSGFHSSGGRGSTGRFHGES